MFCAQTAAQALSQEGYEQAVAEAASYNSLSGTQARRVAVLTDSKASIALIARARPTTAEDSELLLSVDRAAGYFDEIRYTHTKAHAGVPGNEEVDLAAGEAAMLPRGDTDQIQL